MMKLFLVGLLLVTGCTNAQRAQWGALGSKHRITLYSGGQAVRTWISTGKVVAHEHGTGFYFQDEDGKLIEIQGEIVVEQL